MCIQTPDTTNAEFQPCLKQIDNYLKKVQAENTICLGDFNFPFVKWYEVENTVIQKIQSGGPRDEHMQAQALFDCADKYLIQQLITTPTRINNVLDLIFTDRYDI